MMRLLPAPIWSGAALLALSHLVNVPGWLAGAAAPLEQLAPAIQCKRAVIPPPAPDGGAVIAGPPDPDSSEPNGIVIPGDSGT